jgi:hypothetical protein
VRPKHIRGQRKAMQPVSAPQASVVAFQENLGNVERVLNKNMLPQPEQVKMLEASLESQWLDPERKQKARKFLDHIERIKLAQQRKAAERRAKQEAEVG